jgi:hypothetical protein
MSGGAGGHLRPHPTEVDETRNIAKKMEMRHKTGAFFYAFDPTNYCDIEIFNKTKEETTRIYEGLAAALRYSELPVLFFTCYDVGPNETLGVFVRHVVCTMVQGDTIYFFDMRNLRQISERMQAHLEAEFSRFAGRTLHLVNLACAGQHKCLYLQRYKGKTEMGWCIGWALLFLDHLTDNPEFASMTKQSKTKHVVRLYRWVDKQLSSHKSNAFIEQYYIRRMGL